MNSQPLILASSSVYRRELLSRLQVPFSVVVPDIDETPLTGETAPETALRLSIAKAAKVAKQHSDALVIGSDQVAIFDGIQLGKPHTHENAVWQLRMTRGNTVDFHTALCLFNGRTGKYQAQVVLCRVKFRDLTDTQIERYLLKEQPYHCSASAKAEGLGIALIKKVEGEDPNALIGLPLIALVEMLEKEGSEVV